MSAAPLHDFPPASDPTALTTQQLLIEIEHLKELVNARIDGVETQASRSITISDRRFGVAEDTSRLVQEQGALIVELRTNEKLQDERVNSLRRETEQLRNSSATAIDKAEEATTKRFECVAADTPVLCADLVWRPAGDLLVGDELIGVEEQPTDGLARRGRRFRRAQVTDNSVVRDALLLITTSDGAVRCNYHHPWLVRSHGSAWAWVNAEDLQPGFEVAKPMDVWTQDRTWESGWLAGMFDGEGCLSMGKGRVQLSVTQRESATSDLIAAVLKERLGKDPLTYRVEPGQFRHTQPFFHFLVTSRPDVLKILGSTRSPRLLVRADQVWEGHVIASRGSKAVVTAVEPAGTGLIARLSTSTHTYIAGGFAMHNSVNEFRAQSLDQAARFMPREVVEATTKELRGAIDNLTHRLDQQAGAAAGASKTIGYLLAVATVIISLIVLFANRSSGAA